MDIVVSPGMGILQALASRTASLWEAGGIDMPLFLSSDSLASLALRPDF